MEQTHIPVNEQVVIALDGRPQRWLALRAAIPESDLSKKLKGKMPFTDDELETINTLLKVEIKRMELNGVRS